MTKRKRGSVVDGVKIASQPIEAAEMLATAQNMSRSKWQQFVYDLKEKVLMGGTIARMCGLWYVMVLVFHW
jgi:hypothetical protein